MLIDDAPSNRVGGSAAGETNLISGNSTADNPGFAGVSIVGAEATNNLVLGNLIGLDANGTLPLPNSRGVAVMGASHNRIGGTNAGDSNAIAGNKTDIVIEGTAATNNTVQGNLIGTDRTGTMAVSFISSRSAGVTIIDASDNLVGGQTAAARNTIAGSFGAGVNIRGAAASRNRIHGNFIGTDITGRLPLPNELGILIQGGSDNRIGGVGGTEPDGPCSGACNLISANGSTGLFMAGTNNIAEGNFIGTDVTGRVGWVISEMASKCWALETDWVVRIRGPAISSPGI